MFPSVSRTSAISRAVRCRSWAGPPLPPADRTDKGRSRNASGRSTETNLQSLILYRLGASAPEGGSSSKRHEDKYLKGACSTSSVSDIKSYVACHAPHPDTDTARPAAARSAGAEDFRLFRSRKVAAGNLATVAIYAGLSTFTFLLTGVLAASRRVTGSRRRSVALAGHADHVRPGARVWPASVASRPTVVHNGWSDHRGDPRRAHDPARRVRELPDRALARRGRLCSRSSGDGRALTAAILGGIDERHAGIGSAINNAIARVAGLLAVAAIGGIVAARFASNCHQLVAYRQVAPSFTGDYRCHQPAVRAQSAPAAEQ